MSSKAVANERSTDDSQQSIVNGKEMGRKIVAWLVSGVLVALLGVNVVWAEQAEEKEHPTGRSVVVWPAGEPGWLGARLTDVSPEKAHELKLPGEYGAMVNEVDEGSPAAKAGLAANDVILEFAGERVRSTAQLRRLVRETPPGRTIPFQFSHAGQIRSSNAVVGARQSEERSRERQARLRALEARRLAFEERQRDRQQLIEERQRERQQRLEERQREREQRLREREERRREREREGQWL